MTDPTNDNPGLVCPYAEQRVLSSGRKWIGHQFPAGGLPQLRPGLKEGLALDKGNLTDKDRSTPKESFRE